MSPAAPFASFRRLLRRFRRNRKGASALEFAIVAPIFLALLFAIIETALMFFASQVLETVTQDAAREIMTGQAQGAGMSQSQFATYVCGQVPALFNCNNITIDVQSYSSFSQISFPNQIDSHGNLITSNLGYNPGGPGCTVLVRVFYPWQLFVTGLGYNISNFGNNQRLLTAAAAFQNEPYTSGTPCS